jgi:hypothetical protein
VISFAREPVRDVVRRMGMRPKVTLELGEPLGDRELLDGSTYPPAPIGATLFG